MLEIGPFTKPMLSGPNVKYLDIMDRAQLIERAKALGIDPEGTPEIHFVAKATESYPIDETFSAVVSSHCLEHQPDLVRHLNEVDRVLAEGGTYFAIIPDKRYCFDHFIAESTIAGVLDSYLEKRILNRAGSIIEHRVLTTHNDCARHWKGDHGAPINVGGRVEHLRSTLDEIDRHKGEYLDTHAWQFTPDSFRAICNALVEIGLIRLAPVVVFQTPYGRNEFCAVLSRAKH
jgi:SAM-dependent methyltransferase